MKCLMCFRKSRRWCYCNLHSKRYKKGTLNKKCVNCKKNELGYRRRKYCDFCVEEVKKEQYEKKKKRQKERYVKKFPPKQTLPYWEWEKELKERQEKYNLKKRIKMREKRALLKKIKKKQYQ